MHHPLLIHSSTMGAAAVPSRSASGEMRGLSRPTSVRDPKAPATRRGAREISVCV